MAHICNPGLEKLRQEDYLHLEASWVTVRDKDSKEKSLKTKRLSDESKG